MHLVYDRRKQEACERLGINSISKKLPATTSDSRAFRASGRA